MHYLRTLIFTTLALALLSASAVGDTRPAEVLLTVSGNIRTSDGGASVDFDRTALEGFAVHTVRTTTDWTDGVTTFRGPLVSDVLAAAGNLGMTITATALNDYSVAIPVVDFTRYPVILAMEADGKTLTRRDKGPLWIVYPRDDHSELATPETNAKWIWQLRSLEAH